MALSTHQENKVVSTDNKAEASYKVTPRYAVQGSVKDNTFIVQIALPGTKKEDIEIKLLPNYFILRAQRNNILYALDLELNKIEPEASEAEYEEGLLRVTLKKYNPLEHAYEVKIE